MRFRFVVEVEVERSQGKFAGRDELAEQIQGWLEGADEGQLEGENGGEYSVSSFEVYEEEEPKPERKLRAKVAVAAPAVSAQKPVDPFAGFPAPGERVIDPAGCSPIAVAKLSRSMTWMIRIPEEA